MTVSDSNDSFRGAMRVFSESEGRLRRSCELWQVGSVSDACGQICTGYCGSRLRIECLEQG